MVRDPAYAAGTHLRTEALDLVSCHAERFVLDYADLWRRLR
jgi:hypothetical protein